MTLDPQVVAHLRVMFLSGAAPSRLIRHIAEHHSGDPNWPRYVQQYFWEAFSVVMLSMENQAPDIPFDEKDFSFLNTDVLHDIVRRVPIWRDAVIRSLPGHRTWCDGLEMTTDDLQLIEKVHPESHPSLRQSWPSMNSSSREFVRQAMINSQAWYERVQILSRLVEQLQKQVIDLEKRLDSTGQSE